MFTNKSNYPLPIAVWLATDTYDGNSEDKAISATALLKPLKEIVLANQNKKGTKQLDLDNLLPSRMGTAYHSAIEQAWLNEDLHKTLINLGLSEQQAKTVIVNPTSVNNLDYPIYVEKRSSKVINGWTISGKFDLVDNGQVNDIKSTSVYSYMLGSNDENHRLQGSIYRWLNPEIITNEFIRINYIFTDWSKQEARKKHDYPQQRILSKELMLHSIEDTEEYIKNKLDKVDSFLGSDQSILPNCTDSEMWISDTVYKYYSSIDLKRATKVFTTYSEAINYQLSQGKGFIKTHKGEPKRCNYCSVSHLCKQREELQHVQYG